MVDMLTDWTDAHTQMFQKETFTFGHNLEATGLFTDEALIELLENHPSEELDVCSMVSIDPRYPNKHSTGDFRGVSAETLLEAVKAGRIWVNVRRAMNLNPKYREVLDSMYGELGERAGHKAFSARGGILISSPSSQTPYHFDKTETILWHVRGRKRIYVYPLTQEFISDEDYENTITHALIDDLPYKPAYDDQAIILDLEPGQAVTWPLNSPHRVDNSEFCVSVTTEYSTRECIFKNAGMIANATLRQKFGMTPMWSEETLPSRYMKFALGQVLKKTGMAVNTTGPDLVTFKVDPEIEGFVVDTEPFERNF